MTEWLYRVIFLDSNILFGSVMPQNLLNNISRKAMLRTSPFIHILYQSGIHSDLINNFIYELALDADWLPLLTFKIIH